MLVRHHVSRRPVRRAVKITREALNHALDVAEPKIEKAAVELEDFSRDTWKTLRKGSLERLDDLRGNLDQLEKQVRRKVPGASRRNVGKIALVAAGLAVLSIAIWK